MLFHLLCKFGHACAHLGANVKGEVLAHPRLGAAHVEALACRQHNLGPTIAKLERSGLPFDCGNFKPARADFLACFQLHVCAGVGREAHVEILACAHVVDVAGPWRKAHRHIVGSRGVYRTLRPVDLKVIAYFNAQRPLDVACVRVAPHTIDGAITVNPTHAQITLNLFNAERAAAAHGCITAYSAQHKVASDAADSNVALDACDAQIASGRRLDGGVATQAQRHAVVALLNLHLSGVDCHIDFGVGPAAHGCVAFDHLNHNFGVLPRDDAVIHRFTAPSAFCVLVDSVLLPARISMASSKVSSPLLSASRMRLRSGGTLAAGSSLPGS